MRESGWVWAGLLPDHFAHTQLRSSCLERNKVGWPQHASFSGPEHLSLGSPHWDMAAHSWEFILPMTVFVKFPAPAQNSDISNLSQLPAPWTVSQIFSGLLPHPYPVGVRTKPHWPRMLGYKFSGQTSVHLQFLPLTGWYHHWFEDFSRCRELKLGPIPRLRIIGPQAFYTSEMAQYWTGTSHGERCFLRPRHGLQGFHPLDQRMWFIWIPRWQSVALSSIISQEALPLASCSSPRHPLFKFYYVSWEPLSTSISNMN